MRFDWKTSKLNHQPGGPTYNRHYFVDILVIIIGQILRYGFGVACWSCAKRLCQISRILHTSHVCVTLTSLHTPYYCGSREKVSTRVWRNFELNTSYLGWVLLVITCLYKLLSGSQFSYGSGALISDHQRKLNTELKWNNLLGGLFNPSEKY